MGSGNWIIDNLNNALETWNKSLSDIWGLINQSPEAFKGGTIWNVIVDINGALKAIGFALLVLFFVIGVVRTSSFTEVKRPEQAIRLFLRFVLAKAVVSYGMDLMLALFKLSQGIISTISQSIGDIGSAMVSLPVLIEQKIAEVTFLQSIPLWIVTLLGSLFITILSFVMLMTVYGRFFKLYLYVAISPIPFASFAGEGTSQIGKAFFKSFAGVCLEGAIIVLACVIFSAFADAPPNIIDTSLSAVQLVWNYIAELIFNLLVLVGTVKMADRVVKEMMGL